MHHVPQSAFRTDPGVPGGTWFRCGSDGPMMSHVLPAEFTTDLLILLLSQKKSNFAVPERVNLDILESSCWHLLRHFFVLVAGFKPIKRKNYARQIWIHQNSSSPNYRGVEMKQLEINPFQKY